MAKAKKSRMEDLAAKIEGVLSRMCEGEICMN